VPVKRIDTDADPDSEPVEGRWLELACAEDLLAAGAIARAVRIGAIDFTVAVVVDAVRADFLR
jgi:hypothetical protein